MRLAFFVMCVFFSYSSPLALADVLPPASHLLTRCIKLVNLDLFPDVVVLAAISNPGSSPTIYKVRNNECLRDTYKFSTTDLYWISVEMLKHIGEVDKIKTKTITWSIDGAVFSKIVPANLNHLFADIHTMNSVFISNSSHVTSETIECSLYSESLHNLHKGKSLYNAKNQHDMTFSLYVSKRIVKYNKKLYEDTQTFHNNPDVQKLQRRRLLSVDNSY